MDDELATLQDIAVKFRRQFGQNADACKAKLTIEIALVANDTTDPSFRIITAIKQTHPKRPPSISMAMGSADDNSLYVLASGSSKTGPKQLKLTTEDGRIIDQETGEVLD